MNGFSIRGRPDVLARLLDRILVRCTPAGIEERDQELIVWLAPGSPPLPHSTEVEVKALTLPAAATLDDDQPLLVADDLVVRAPWVAPLADFGGVELVVPRGMAFGSGEHESTKLALRAMRGALLEKGSLADVGTGSGILALYAHRRGCAPLCACDIDEPAVEAAAALVPGLRAVLGGPAELQRWGPFDHVVANMTGSELLAAMPGLLDLWNRRGAMVLSGIRHSEAESVQATLPVAPARTLRGTDFLAFALQADRR